MWRAAVAALVLGAPSTRATDADGDGLDDGFEMACARKWRPAVYLASGEEFGPSTVKDYLRSCYLREKKSCGWAAAANSSGLAANGLCASAVAVAARAAHFCFHDPDSTVGQATASLIGGYSDPYYLRCLDCYGTTCDAMGADRSEARGSHGAALSSVPFYVHVFPDGEDVHVQYWFFYPFNGPTAGLGTHQGDWEHFSLKLDRGCSERKGYQAFAHGDASTWRTDFSQLLVEDGVTAIFSAYHSHATYISAGSHDGGTAVTKDHTSKGDRWYPDELVNAGETTCASDGRRPMGGTPWLDFTGEWGTASAWDGVLDNGACPSGPHLQWNKGNPRACGGKYDLPSTARAAAVPVLV